MNDTSASEHSLRERLDLYLSRVAPYGFSGALLVARGGEVLLNEGYGLADRAAGIPNTAHTVFSLGSVTKQFTAAAIMKLEAAGRLQTSDAITRYVSGVPGDKAGITLHHLLTHTAGLINYTGEDFEMASREQALRTMLQAPLRFPPGERYDYSNAGYSLLAAIVEEVSGSPYEAFLHEQLFEPAGMELTGYRLPRWEEQTVARWYVDEQDNGTPLEKAYPSWNLLGNGDMLSTTLDMNRWHRALQGNGFLPQEAKAKLYRPFLQDYAYGWIVKRTPHGTLVEHSGGSSYGTSAHFARYVDADLVFMLFCNEMASGLFPMPAVREAVRTLLFGGEADLPPAVPAARPQDLSDLEGERELQEGGRVSITQVNRRLSVVPLDEHATLSLFGISLALQRVLVERSLAVVTAAFAGDLAPLEESLTNSEGRLASVSELIEVFAKKNDKDDLLTLGPVPSSFVPGALDVFLASRSGRGEGALLFIWKEERNIGCALLDGDPYQRLATPCLPGSHGALLGYHLGMARPVQVHVKR